jgi:hypothetical protein
METQIKTYPKKYEEFANKFEALCDEYAAEDFDAREIKQVCDEIIENYAA